MLNSIITAAFAIAIFDGFDPIDPLPPGDGGDPGFDYICSVTPEACDPNHVTWVQVDDMLIPCYGGDPIAYLVCINQTSMPCPDPTIPCY